MRLLDDRLFLAGVSRFERVLARVLILAVGVLSIAATVDLLRHLLAAASSDATPLFNGGLIGLLGDVLTVLIALEVLQNITAYLLDHSVQLELVLGTALTAVARKIIVLPTDKGELSQSVIALGLSALALSAAYWLIRKARKGKPSGSD